MKLLAVTTAALVALPAALAQSSTPTQVSVSFDCVYDNPSGDLHTVACSDGVNGLLNRGFTDFASVPSFPFIGGAPAVTGFNSPKCGSCWNLTFAGRTISVTAIDTGGKGFNIALAAMNNLTNNQAVDLGRVNATALEVPATDCGLGGADRRTHPPLQPNACPASFNFKSPPV